jgi:hypothetical protein
MRLHNPEPQQIEALIAAGHTDELIVQFNEVERDPALLRLIDRLCSARGANVTVRFFGPGRFDCAVLESLPSCRSLSLDCLSELANPGSLASLPLLEELAVGVFEERHDGVLQFPNVQRVRSLSIGDSLRKDWDLSPLANFAHLGKLILTSQHRNIEALADLPLLADLRLDMIKRQVDLAFVNRMVGLRALGVWLGGREDLGELAHAGLQRLELIRVKGLSRLSPAAFPGLETLTVEDEPRIKELDLSHNQALRSLTISKCKGLRKIRLPAGGKLERVMLHTTGFEPDELLAMRLPESVAVLDARGFGRRRDEEIARELRNRGYGSAFSEPGELTALSPLGSE